MGRIQHPLGHNREVRVHDGDKVSQFVKHSQWHVGCTENEAPLGGNLNVGVEVPIEALPKGSSVAAIQTSQVAIGGFTCEALVNVRQIPLFLLLVLTIFDVLDISSDGVHLFLLQGSNCSLEKVMSKK